MNRPSSSSSNLPQLLPPVVEVMKSSQANNKKKVVEVVDLEDPTETTVDSEVFLDTEEELNDVVWRSNTSRVSSSSSLLKYHHGSSSSSSFDKSPSSSQNHMSFNSSTSTIPVANIADVVKKPQQRKQEVSSEEVVDIDSTERTVDETLDDITDTEDDESLSSSSGNNRRRYRRGRSFLKKQQRPTSLSVMPKRASSDMSNLTAPPPFPSPTSVTTLDASPRIQKLKLKSKLKLSKLKSMLNSLDDDDQDHQVQGGGDSEEDEEFEVVYEEETTTAGHVMDDSYFRALHQRNIELEAEVAKMKFQKKQQNQKYRSSRREIRDLHKAANQHDSKLQALQNLNDEMCIQLATQSTLMANLKGEIKEYEREEEKQFHTLLNLSNQLKSIKENEDENYEVMLMQEEELAELKSELEKSKNQNRLLKAMIEGIKTQTVHEAKAKLLES